MVKILPVLYFFAAALAVLVLAGLGATGNMRGAIRYVRTWSFQVLILVLLALVIFAVIS